MPAIKIVTLAGTAALVAALLSGCGANSTSVELLGNHFVKPDCTGDSAVFLTGGSVNLSETTSYLASFTVKNNVKANSLTVSGQLLSGPEQADVILEKQRVHYASTPAFTFADEDLPLLAPYETGAATGSFLTTNLISPAAASVLINSVAPSLGAGSSAQLRVTVTLLGHNVGGASVQSNPVTYPITVFNGGAGTCPAGKVEAATGACYNPGQDGVSINCVAP